MERLQKVIANRGYCSRRKAEEMITAGKVVVNGKKITELGTKIKGNETIIVDGADLGREDKVYYLFYKPEGVVSSASDEKGRKTVLDFFHVSERIYPVGRLDNDSSGLIMLTNDGDFTNKVIHPSSIIEKKYIVSVEGIVTGYKIKQLREGIDLEGQKSAPARVKLKRMNKKKQTTLLEVTIHEGKNRQVRRMFEKVGHPVIKLKREEIAFLTLAGLAKGEYRELTPKEVKKIFSLVSKES